MLLAKEGMVLQGMIDRLIEIGLCCGMEMNVGKTKVMKILREPFPIQNMIDPKQQENVKCFKYLSSMIANDAIYTHKIQP